ncbi:MAG: adenylate/guanylate cyclase domain-containing protein [Chitinophagaceae bacterium]
MFSPATRRNILRIIPFGIIWFVFSLVYTQLEKGLLGSLDYYPATDNPYNFERNIFLTPVFGLVTGLLIGTIEVYILNKLFLHRSFTKKIVFKTLIYLAIIAAFLIALTVNANAMELGTGFLDKHAWHNTSAFFSDYSVLSVAVYMASIIAISQFYNEVSDNIGPVVLLNFFTGKYHRATSEVRIFMFLDMKSSTTIAEHLGHSRYFELLRNYYADLSDPIVNYSGEIYQYVGDEIVVSWRLKNGLKDNNCIRCFFAMKTALQKRAIEYDEQFGVTPSFKAGFHFGTVTTGEIGVIKKEIIFTGDVLNTTARIQSLCNSYQVDILLSGDLVNELETRPDIQFINLGVSELRGRDEKVELYTIGD